MLRSPLKRPLALRTVLAVTIAGLCGCRDSTGPSTILGAYHLTACQPDTGWLPVPCQFPNPGAGDSLRVYGSVLTFKADSTWTDIWDEAQCWGGVWSPEAIDTLYGTFRAIPGDASAYQVWTLPANTTFGSAVFTGSTMELYSRWKYQR